MDRRALAVWNLKALHDGAMNQRYGNGWNQRALSSYPKTAIDVTAVSQQITEVAPDVWQAAFADWRQMDDYAPALGQAGIQLLQKSPAEEDFTEHLRHFITHSPTITGIDRLIVVGATGDLKGVLGHDRLAGVKVTAIVPPGAQVGDFKPFSELALNYQPSPEPAPITITGPVMHEIEKALKRSLYSLQIDYGSWWNSSAQVEKGLRALIPSFNAVDLGYHSLDSFLNSRSDIIQSRPTPDGYEYALTDDHQPTVNEPIISLEEKRQRNRKAMYLRISAQEGLRLPDPIIMWVGVDIYAAFLRDPEGFDNFRTLDQECLRQLRRDFPHATLTDSKKIRQVLFKCYLFTPGNGDKIGFREDITTLQDVEDLYFDLITKRISAKAPQPVDFVALSLATTGETTSAHRLEKKFGEIE